MNTLKIEIEVRVIRKGGWVALQYDKPSGNGRCSFIIDRGWFGRILQESGVAGVLSIDHRFWHYPYTKEAIELYDSGQTCLGEWPKIESDWFDRFETDDSMIDRVFRLDDSHWLTQNGIIRGRNKVTDLWTAYYGKAEDIVAKLNGNPLVVDAEIIDNNCYQNWDICGKRLVRVTYKCYDPKIIEIDRKGMDQSTVAEKIFGLSRVDPDHEDAYTDDDDCSCGW